MKNPVSILSFGISCPGGTSPAMLEDFSKWPVQAVPQAGSEWFREVSRVDLALAPSNRWRMRPRLRRASPLSHHLIEAIAQALESRPEISPARVGVVGAFFFGCLEYSVKFYKGLSADGRRFASPTSYEAGISLFKYRGKGLLGLRTVSVGGEARSVGHWNPDVFLGDALQIQRRKRGGLREAYGASHRGKDEGSGEDRTHARNWRKSRSRVMRILRRSAPRKGRCVHEKTGPFRGRLAEMLWVPIVRHAQSYSESSS